MSENAASKRQIMANKGNKEEFLDSLDHDSGFRSKDDITGSFRSSFDDTKRSSTESGAASSIDLQSPECLSFGSIHDADLAIDHLRTNKSPQKRRHGNENRFSPKAKCVREISAKLVLKEKSRSENIIASTPKRANLWGKFSSFLPSREVFGSLDQEEIPKQANTFQIPKAPTLASLGKSHNSFNSEAFDSFDFSNFDNTDQTGDSKHNNLFTAAICDDFESKISGSAALDQILESSVHDPVKILPAKKIHGSRASSSFIPNKLEVIEEISPAKDKVVMPRRKYDILGNLPGENHLCLDIIMAKLPDPDILSMCMVSKLWNKIVMNNKKASARRLQYLKDREASKENKLGSQAEKKGDDVKVVKAFNLCSGNVDSSIKYKSPPVSPSKRKFHENQKVSFFN